MPDLELTAEPRVVLGKNVAKLRRAGVTPANIFGHNIDSQAIQAPTAELTHALRSAGGTRILKVSLTGESSPRMVLVRHISRKPTTDQLLHVDFYEVSMTEKTTVVIPLVLVGVAPIVASGEGTVYQQVNSLAVECLPGDIPGQIEVDISGLEEVHAAIHLSDIHLPANVTTSVDPGEVIVTVAASMGAEEEVAAVEAAEGEVQAEGTAGGADEQEPA